jgi:hypothetical protein
MEPDFQFSDHGSLWLCTPKDDAALEHLRENVSGEAQWSGNALAVEPRYVGGLIDSLRDNGWTVHI